MPSLDFDYIKQENNFDNALDLIKIHLSEMEINFLNIITKMILYSDEFSMTNDNSTIIKTMLNISECGIAFIKNAQEDINNICESETNMPTQEMNIEHTLQRAHTEDNMTHAQLINARENTTMDMERTSMPIQENESLSLHMVGEIVNNILNRSTSQASDIVSSALNQIKNVVLVFDSMHKEEKISSFIEKLTKILENYISQNDNSYDSFINFISESRNMFMDLEVNDSGTNDEMENNSIPLELRNLQSKLGEIIDKANDVLIDIAKKQPHNETTLEVAEVAEVAEAAEVNNNQNTEQELENESQMNEESTENRSEMNEESAGQAFDGPSAPDTNIDYLINLGLD